MRKILFGVAACLLVAAPVAADAPAYLPVQGFLANTDGTPVDGGTDLTFALYAVNIGGTPLWQETQTVAVDEGFFTVYLGDTSVLDLATFRDNETVWLGVSVEADPEMARFQIATTGYAAFAQYAGDAATLSGTPASDFLTAASTVDWSDLTNVPAALADGDDDTTYTAGAGLTLTDTTFAADQTTVEGWARGVCYDTTVELRAVLDSIYAAGSHSHAWGTITGMPAGFADGIDNDTLFTPGAGLTLLGTVFSLDFAQANTWTGAQTFNNLTASGTLTGFDIGILVTSFTSPAIANGACNSSIDGTACAAGYTAIAGGCTSWNNNVTVTNEWLNTASNTWRCGFCNNSGGVITPTVNTICARVQ